MKLVIKRSLVNMLALAAGIAVISSCNKENLAPTSVLSPAPSGQTLAAVINSDPGFSILKAAIARATPNAGEASLSALLADSTASLTIFAPTDAAFQLSGIPSAAALAAFRPGQLDTILRYHIVGQQVISDTIAKRTPNLQLPSLFQLVAPSPSLPPGLRMPLFPASNGSLLWVNNVPITAAPIKGANGILYKTGAVLLPPSATLWDRIAADPNLTYLKAAIQKADQGSTPATSFQAALSNPAANFTVFAPTDAAFRLALTLQITQALMAPPYNLDAVTAQAQAQALAATTGVFTNPMLANVLTPMLLQGLVAYHVLGIRDFSVSLPTTPKAYQTLFNTAVPTHPGVTLKATFGTTGVTSATVKGLMNPTASNILINPTPGTGTSDQHYINGVLHEIDQVLLPQ